jgi:choline dehydrogenase-like flavoprotein
MARPDHADVLVIGAGASGAILSLQMAQAGLRVVCLDQGGSTAPADHPHTSPDWQHQRQNRWSPNPNLRQAAADYPVETTQSNALMWNAVGGSTNIYTALWPRYRPSDFRKGIEHGQAPDWPFDYEALAPFYDESDRLVGVSGLPGDRGLPPCPYPTGPLPLGAGGRAMAQGFEKLGWHWWPMPSAVLSEPYDGRPACNSCGACAAGCPRGSMAKMSITLWPRAVAAGTDLRPLCRVERIETDAAGRATGAVYVDRATGLREIQTADRVVVAANGVGTPRLLLMSASARHPNGLANGNDVVGRYLLHHTLVSAELFLDGEIDSHMGNAGVLVSSEFAENDPSRGFINGFNFNIARGGPAGMTAIGTFGNAPAPWGAGHHAWFRRHFSRTMVAHAIGDDLPQASNRITLSDTLTDGDGLPAAKLHYVPHENDRRMMAYMADRLRDLAAATGAFDHRINDYIDATGTYRTPAWHLLGTCRMGSDPETSVTDGWHRSWEVPNLYVVDGSSLATAGVVNPTSTVCALALRAGRHLAAQRRATDGMAAG